MVNRTFNLTLIFTGHKIYFLRIIQESGNALRVGDIQQSVLEFNSSYLVHFDDVEE
jgi:hypothetical protein